MEKKEYTFKEISNTSIAADVYYTRENAGSKSPIALHFHGGNFVVGSKALLGEQHVKKLLELGFIVVSANYRLCPTTTVYDGPVQDAFEAYNWARTTLPGLLKSDTGIEADGSRIVVFGHSCGATLALLTAKLANPPRAILDLFGMKYLQDPFYNTAPPTAAKGPPLDKDFTDQVYKDIPPPSSGPSPMGPNGPDLTNYRVAWMFRNLREGTLIQTIVADGNFDRVDPASLFSTGSFPPTYFIHGTADALVDHKFSGRAHEELKARGVETELVLVPDAPHGFDARAQPGDENFAIVAKGFEFLRAHV